MQNKLYNKTLALAGIAQAANLVKDIAQTGKYDEAAFQTSIYSIFQTHPSSVLAIYQDDPQHLKLGLQTLITMLESSTIVAPIRYMLALMRLQKKISRSTSTQKKLAQRLEQTKKQVDYFSLTHPTVIANLADVYLNSISPFKFRIIIWGNQRILTIAENMEKIRALLLAGIRSSVLWRQLGGSRLQLIFFRRKICDMAKKILAEMENEKT